MPGIRLASAVNRFGSLAIALMLILAGCTTQPREEDLFKLQVYQKWQLQPGDDIDGHRVVAGLGDISIALDGKSAYAPFDGRAQQDQRGCLIFSTPDVPAYLFRLCGLSNHKLGDRRKGDDLGSGAQVHIATLRKQPDGTWAIVEPSKPILQKILTKS